MTDGREHRGGFGMEGFLYFTAIMSVGLGGTIALAKWAQKRRETDKENQKRRGEGNVGIQ